MRAVRFVRKLGPMLIVGSSRVRAGAKVAVCLAGLGVIPAWWFSGPREEILVGAIGLVVLIYFCIACGAAWIRSESAARAILKAAAARPRNPSVLVHRVDVENSGTQRLTGLLAPIRK
jgi:hypothetical protein